MKITHYFISYSYGTQSKNRLQEEFESFLKSLNFKLIYSFEINALLQKIEDKVKELNAKFSRCNAIQIRFQMYNDKYILHNYTTVGQLKE